MEEITVRNDKVVRLLSSTVRKGKKARGAEEGTKSPTPRITGVCSSITYVADRDGAVQVADNRGAGVRARRELDRVARLCLQVAGSRKASVVPDGTLRRAGSLVSC